MADAAVFIFWDKVVKGREQRAAKVYNDLRKYLDRAQRNGDIKGFETGVFGPASGLGGFLAVRGNQDQLGELRKSRRFRLLMLRTKLVVTQLKVAKAMLGANMFERIREYENEIAELDKW
jgi:hypothetical protein